VQPWQATDDSAHIGSGVPESLVDLVMPMQARRTETLTGQAAHTSDIKAARQQMKQSEKELMAARP
jgi:hypothetical protein